MSAKSTTLDFSPRGYLIRYPLLVNTCIRRFIDDFQDDFKQLKNGTFKLRKTLSLKSLKELFTAYLNESIPSVLSKALEGRPLSKNDWIIIVDSGSDRRVRYEMNEKDVNIGLKKIETIFNSLFNTSMKQVHCDTRTIYCKHRSLLSDDWIKICSKKAFGKNNLVVINSPALPIVSEVTTDKTIKSLSKKEQRLIVEEASQWLLNSLTKN